MAPSRIWVLTPSEQQDFREQMMWAVLEEAQLQEVAAGSVDRLAQGNVTHGPWHPSDCSDYLVRCFDAGLVTVTDSAGDDAVLADDEARALLASPERWTEHETRHWCLSPQRDEQRPDITAWPPVLSASNDE